MRKILKPCWGLPPYDPNRSCKWWVMPTAGQDGMRATKGGLMPVIPVPGDKNTAPAPRTLFLSQSRKWEEMRQTQCLPWLPFNWVKLASGFKRPENKKKNNAKESYFKWWRPYTEWCIQLGRHIVRVSGKPGCAQRWGDQADGGPTGQRCQSKQLAELRRSLWRREDLHLSRLQIVHGLTKRSREDLFIYLFFSRCKKQLQVTWRQIQLGIGKD